MKMSRGHPRKFFGEGEALSNCSFLDGNGALTLFRGMVQSEQWVGRSWSDQGGPRPNHIWYNALPANIRK